MAAVSDFPAVELQHHVAVLEAGAGGGTSRHHVPNERAARILEVEFLRQGGSHVLDHDAQISARDVSVGDQAPHDVAGETGWDRETYALAAAGTAHDGGVDPDQAAVDVHQRAARVARIDRRVGLDEVLVVLDAHIPPTGRAHDPFSDRLPDAEWIADCQHDVTDLHVVTVGQGNNRQIVRVDLDHGDIGLRIPADDFRGEFTSI